ncbi:MAG: hypothetical protein QM676_02170 [Novosphingobium sp.]
MNRLGLLALGTAAAWAAQAPAHAAKPAATPAQAPAQAPAEPIVDQDGAAPAAVLSPAELDRNRGGETLVLSNQSLNAVTSGNTLNGNYTAGAITLSDRALSNFNGVGNFAINTGAQVTLQSGLNLTINLGR